MTRLERYIRESEECGATVVIREIADKVNKLEREMMTTKNGFRRTCIAQEIERYENDMRTLEKMFID